MTDQPDDDLHALLRDVPPPDDNARERALRVAMTAFDERLAPRRRSTRWLMPVAAALLGVVAVGGAVATLGGNDDDPSQEQAATEVLDADEVDNRAAAGAAAPTSAAAVLAQPAPALVPAESGAGVIVPVLQTDQDVIALVAVSSTGTATAGAADAALAPCDRAIAIEADDLRKPDGPRRVLVTVEDTGTDSFAVLLAPPDAANACEELDRVALP